MDLTEDQFVGDSVLFHNRTIADRPEPGSQIWQKYERSTPNGWAVWVSLTWSESEVIAEYVFKTQLKVLVELKRIVLPVATECFFCGVGYSHLICGRGRPKSPEANRYGRQGYCSRSTV